MDRETVSRVLDCIDEQQVLDLACSLVSIPSPRYEEAQLAEFVAGYLGKIGFEVDVQEVPIPGRAASRQAIGRLRGDGTGRSVILCGHLDTVPLYRPDLWTRDPLKPVIEDGWLYGWGAGNMKCGDAAMISAAEAVKKSGVPLRGDLIVAAVMGETAGGLGVRHLLESGVRADVAVVPERTGLDISTIGIGQVKCRVDLEGKLRFRADGGQIHPIEKMVRVMERLGKSYEPIRPGGYLTFHAHPELPGFPQVVVNGISSSGDFCSLTFEYRIVPGQSEDTVRADVQRLLEELTAEDPQLRVSLKIPPSADNTNRALPEQLPSDSLIVRALGRWHRRVLGTDSVVGAGKRLGSPADAGDLNLAGIQAVTYGPGVSDPWPTADERNSVPETIAATRVLALAAADMCTSAFKSE